MYHATIAPVAEDLSEPSFEALRLAHDALVAERSRLLREGQTVPAELRLKLDELQAEIAERIFDNMPV